MGHIQIDLSFPREEKLRQLARDLEVPVVYAAAHVAWLWLAVMEKSENRFDGNMDGWTHGTIADFAAWPGDSEKFVHALIECGRPKKKGFIEERNGVLYLHEWKKWQGPGLLNKMEYERNQRAEAAKVKALYAEKKGKPAEGDDTVVKTMLDLMDSAGIHGPIKTKREAINGWRIRKIIEQAQTYVMGDGKGLHIFEVVKAMDGDRYRPDAKPKPLAEVEAQFKGFFGSKKK